MRKKLPIDGQRRIVKKFAFFPIECNSREVAWWEWVYIEQVYRYAGPIHNEGWKNVKFVDKDYEALCGRSCSYEEPYGFVPECGCPVHDPDL